VLTGTWNVNFPSGWGAPEKAVFPELISWTSSKEDGIKYFSGIVTYTKKFNIPAELINQETVLVLDLGKVSMLADVTLNNKHIGILWKPPFRLDVSSKLLPGENLLTVEVANDWSNRIVGDQKLPKAKRFTSTNITSPTSSDLLWKDAPLLEAGLMGPVHIIPAKRIEIKF
jgi:beta-galactosidase/beta-glucuronidase